MKKKAINPWQWQDNLGFSQAVAVSGGQQLYCSGQTAMGADGAPPENMDMPAQINLAFDNLEEVLRKGGFEMSDVVRLNIYTTDMDRFFGSYGEVMNRLSPIDPKPAITLLGVTRLAFPQLLLEIEATAIK